MRARWSLLLAISLLALVASGCGSSHRATRTTLTRDLVLVPSPSNASKKLPRSVRAAIRRLKAYEHRSAVAMVGIDGCYRLVRDHRTHRLTARRRERC